LKGQSHYTPIHAYIGFKGRSITVGRLDPDGTFVKSNVYRVHTPPSLAIGADTVEELKRQGCKRMKLTTQDGAVYKIPFDLFLRRCFYQTRTALAGRQAFILLDDMTCDTPAPAYEPGNSFPYVDSLRAAGLSERNKPHPGNNFPVASIDDLPLFKAGRE
jgi:hypothetical protein